MSKHGCPSRELLLAYHTGNLPDEQLARDISAHLGQCVKCREILKKFGETEDSLLARLRRPEVELHSDEPQCRDLPQRVGASSSPDDTSAAIVVTCSCGKPFRLDAKYAGTRYKCSKCGTELDVPPTPPELTVALPSGISTAQTRSVPPKDTGAGDQSTEFGTETPPGLPPGSTIIYETSGNYGPYVPSHELAKGGMGRVSLARDEALKRDVALKELLHPASESDVTWQRFVDEAEITGQLEHPGVVPVYALGTDRNGMPFYAMRLVRGDTLKKAILKHHESYSDDGLRELLRRFIAVCQTIAYAHHRGIIHRDLKPSNIMLGEFGETLVMDWGLARPVPPPGSEDSTVGDLAHQHEDRPELTLSGRPVGTPAYMSPEQASADAGPVTPQTDIYSLGAVLYEILCGQVPFPGASADEILKQVRSSSPLAPTVVEPRTPRPLEAICLKAMNRESFQRYPSAKALADDVQRWLDDEPVTVYPEPISARFYRWTRKHKTLATSIAVFGLLLAVVIVFGSVMVIREQEKTLAAQRLADDYAQQATEAKQKATEMETEAEKKTEEADQARQEAADAIQKANQSKKEVDRAKKKIEQLQNDLKNKAEDSDKINQQLEQARKELAAAEATMNKERERAATAEKRVRTLEKDILSLQAEARELRALSIKLTELAKGALTTPTAKDPQQTPLREEDFTERPAEMFDAVAKDKTPCVLTADTTRSMRGCQSIRLNTLGNSDVCITYPRSRNANWDLSKVKALRLALWAHALEASSDIPPGERTPVLYGIRIRLGRGSSYIECRSSSDMPIPWWQWAQWTVPLAGDAQWTRSDVNNLDLSHVDWIEIHLSVQQPGTKVWLENLGFELPKPPSEKTITPVNLSELNTEQNDEAVTQWDDPLEIIFARGMPGISYNLMVAHRLSIDSPWEEAALIPGLGTDFAGRSPTIRHDGLEIIFTSGGPDGADLWRAIRPSVAESWSTPSRIEEVSTDYQERTASLSPDGLELYFVSDRPCPEGMGMRNLYVARRKSFDEPFGPPECLMDLNSMTSELYPCLSADRLTLYFSTSRTPNQGVDIWYTTRPTPDAPWSVPAPLPDINTETSEWAPFESRDGKTFYFHSNRPGGKGNRDLWCIHSWKQPPRLPPRKNVPVNLRELNSPVIDGNPVQSNNPLELLFSRGLNWEQNKSDLMLSRRASVGSPWGPPSPVVELNTTYTEIHPALRSDGLEVFFTSNRPGGKGELDLWRATRSSTTARWSKPECVSSLCSNQWEAGPSLSSDALTLYFYSNRPAPAGGGELDLYVAHRKDLDSPFGPPRFMAELNSPKGDSTPCLSADGLTLYFSSNKRGERFRGDLFYATRDTLDSPWSSPALVPGVNSPETDIGPFESCDGKTFYFVSVRPGGKGMGDIWYVHPWQRPPRLPPRKNVPVNLRELNTPGDDMSGSLSDDSLELYYAWGPRHEQGDLVVSRRADVNSPWGPPTPVTELNSPACESSPMLRFDGLEVFFISDRKGGKGQLDLWRATRPSVTARWSEPELMSDLCSSHHDAGPTLSRDGLTLYFYSDRPAPPGGGEYDLYRARRKDLDSPFGPPEFVADVNTPRAEQMPFLSADGLTLYFSSNQNRRAHVDLFYVTRDTLDSPWSVAAPVPDVNSADSDMSPFESCDGKTFYFVSPRPGGKGKADLWYVHPWQPPPRLPARTDQTNPTPAAGRSPT